jgi:hypothetical protein
MSKTLTRTGQRLGAAMGVLALVAGGLLMGSGGNVSAGTTPPPLDHFLCYQARVAGPKAPPGVQLVNAIQPKPFTPAFGAANAHCNPANKSVPAGVFKVKNPLAHLLCYQIVSQFTPVTVLVTNQFGKAIMKTGPTPTKFCLPSWKDRVGPPGLPANLNQPPNLDHFTCYPLTAVAGAYGFRPPPVVKAEDEFSAPKYTALKLAHANLLCVPTVKILPTGLIYKTQAANDLSLVCFPSSPTPFWKLVYDQNQFGSFSVYPNTEKEALCLPSTLSVQGSTAAG